MTGEPLTLAAALKSLAEGVAAIWARGALLLWCLATVCAVVVLALIAAAHFHITDAATLLRTYGTSLGLAFLVLFVFAGFKSYDERTRPILSLIPLDHGSFWGHAPQTDGRVVTSLTLRFQATNFSKRAIMLSAVRLWRPWVNRRTILTNVLMIEACDGQDYGWQNPILPGSLTYGVANITIDHPVGKIGKPMRVAIGLQDHAGRWHKLAFPHLPTIGTPG